MWTTHTHTGLTQCMKLDNFIKLEAQTTRPSKYGQET